MYLRWVFCLVLGLAIPWFQEITVRPLTRALHVIAKYSYGIYLSHVAILLYVLALPVSTAVRWSLCIAALVVTPVLLYHVIERPMIVVGQRLARRLFPADGQGESATIAGTAPAP
jgi:peptidoglycan/LPS O-acetylase OafA/YrhL